MNWRNLLYFSKGERRALSILLGLITAAWITLLITDNKQTTVNNIPESTVSRTGPRPSPKLPDTISSPKKKTTSSPKSVSSFRKENLYYSRESNKSNGRKNSYPYNEKFPPGTIVELNTADTTTLKKVPGIGSTFAKRIIKYRELLGGFYTVDQLGEVYGIDEKRFNAMKSWFSVDVSLICPYNVHKMSNYSLRKHPYLNDRQAKVIEQLRKQKGKLSGWENLQLLEEFTDSDKERLIHYLTFE